MTSAVTCLVSLCLFPFLLPLLLFFSQCFLAFRLAPPWLLILIVKYCLWPPKCVLGGRGPMKTALEIERGPILFPSLLLLQTNTRRPLLPTLFSFRALTANWQTIIKPVNSPLQVLLVRRLFAKSGTQSRFSRKGSLAHELSACCCGKFGGGLRFMCSAESTFYRIMLFWVSQWYSF